MAEDSEKTAGDTPAKHSNAALPDIESPPLSPAGGVAAEDEPAQPSTDLVIFKPQADPQRPKLRFKPSTRRNALMAATIVVATALGTLAGLLTGLGLAEQKQPAVNLAARDEERAAMQRTIASLGTDIAVLKTGLAAAKTSLHGEVTKLTARIDSATPEVTGSIPAASHGASAPLPPARPAIAAAAHRPVVSSWHIRFVRDGEIFVQSRGEVYLVQLGAPLPGLGPVQEVKRRDGRWYVVTPKGLIVARSDRAFFEQF